LAKLFKFLPVLHTEMCIGSHASSRERQMTVRITGHSRRVGYRYGTSVTSHFRRLEYEDGTYICEKAVHPWYSQSPPQEPQISQRGFMFVWRREYWTVPEMQRV